jgi:Glycosyl hydrolases family 2, TIM barrel domain/Beta galactosidase small chain
MNMNAVRMSHYPPDQHFLDACDEKGLYVLDELAGWHGKYATPVGTKLVEEMVVRDVNHPSVVMWDNGNEGGWNNELNDLFAKWDPQQRHVNHPWELFRDLTTKHYPTYQGLLSLAASGKVFMPTEFLHGLYDGGIGAGLEDYWKLMRGPRSAGGFLWAFLDEGVRRPDQNGKIDVNGNMAPDGILGPYREKEASFFSVKEVWSPVIIPLLSLPADFTGTLPVENRYQFTDLAQCMFTWELRALNRPEAAKAGHTIVAQGRIPAPAVAPGASGKLSLNLPTELSGADVLAVTAKDPAGRELWTWTWPLPTVPAAASVTGSVMPISIRETPTELALEQGRLRLAFSKTSGHLASAQLDGKTFPLANGPRLAFGSAALTGFTHHTDSGDEIIEATSSGDLELVRWRLHTDGRLTLDYTYRCTGPAPFLGVGFDSPTTEITAFRWAGQGPYRVWKNRLTGTTLDVWEKTPNDTLTGHNGWQYPEFSGAHAGVRWLTLETTAGSLTAILDAPRFVQVGIPEFPKDAKNATAQIPDLGLAFLDGIAPMGNKFHKASETGPQAQPNQGVGEYHGAVEFRFGSGH